MEAAAGEEKVRESTCQAAAWFEAHAAGVAVEQGLAGGGRSRPATNCCNLCSQAAACGAGQGAQVRTGVGSSASGCHYELAHRELWRRDEAGVGVVQGGQHAPNLAASRIKRW